MILTSIPECESFSLSFAFNSVNENHSHSHPASGLCPALMCESDRLSSKILREAARVCANPTIIYFYRPGGWRGLVEVCANPTQLVNIAARGLLQRSGGRESG